MFLNDHHYDSCHLFPHSFIPSSSPSISPPSFLLFLSHTLVFSIQSTHSKCSVGLNIFTVLNNHPPIDFQNIFITQEKDLFPFSTPNLSAFPVLVMITTYTLSHVSRYAFTRFCTYMELPCVVFCWLPSQYNVFNVHICSYMLYLYQHFIIFFMAKQYSINTFTFSFSAFPLIH